MALSLAAGVHALCCGLGVWLAPVRESSSQVPASEEPPPALIWLEGEALSGDSPRSTAAAPPTEQPREAAAPPSAPPPEHSPKPHPEPLARRVPGSQREASPKLAIVPPSAVPNSLEPPEQTEPGAAAQEGTLSETPQPRQPAEPPPEALSLHQLGVGEDNPFWHERPGHPGQAGERQREVMAAQRRLDHTLQQAMLEADQKRGLGPEGPALVAAEEVVQVSTVPPVSEATLLLRTDASGKVVYAELLRVDDAADEWERVKRDLLDRLASVRLRVPPSSGGVTMKMKISSDNQLPSGAHPGLAINMLGIPIKEGDGPRSTRVDILTPKIMVQPPSAVGRSDGLPQLQISAGLLGLYGDLVDIGAPARRVVHAKLLDLEVHPAAP